MQAQGTGGHGRQLRGFSASTSACGHKIEGKKDSVDSPVAAADPLVSLSMREEKPGSKPWLTPRTWMKAERHASHSS